MKNVQEILGNFLNFFVIDPQEDCRCDIEKYDVGKEQNVLFLRNGIVESIKMQKDVFNLPMSYSCLTKEIESLVLNGLFLAEGRTDDQGFYYSGCILNPKFNIDKLSFIQKTFVARSKESKRFLEMEEVSQTQIYFFPEPEYFGTFTYNIDKYGIFLFPERIYCYST